MEWNIQRLAAPYSKETQKCQLCLTEKALISLADSSASLNKRNEIVGKCRHRDKFLLKHWSFFYNSPTPLPSSNQYLPVTDRDYPAPYINHPAFQGIHSSILAP